MNSQLFNQPLRLTFLLILGMFASSAGAASLQATVSKRDLVINEVFQLRIIADTRASSDDIDLSFLEEDFFMGRPNFGTSVNIVNSQRSSRSEWNVSLAPQRIGRVTIPSFELNGAKTEPIQINVTKDELEPKPSDFVEITNQLQKEVLYPQESTELLSRVVIKTDPRRLQNPNISQPKIQGMTINALGDAKQYQSVLDGVEVTVVEQRYKLTADNAGDFTLTGVGFEGTVIYGDSLRGSTRLIATNIEPEQVSITVKSPPQDYRGNWLPTQQLSIEQVYLSESGVPVADQSMIELNVGQSLTRQIILDIHGLDSDRFPTLELPVPDVFRVYSEKPTFQILSNGVTRMIVKQVLIAQKEDQVSINLPSLDWWNSRDNIAEKTDSTNTQFSIKQGEQTLYSIDTSALINNNSTQQISGVSIYWQYATFTCLFIIVLLLSFIVWTKNNDRPKETIENKDHSSHEDQGLVEIIRCGDNSLINYHVNKWLAENPHLDNVLRESINEQLTMMNRYQYSNNTSNWDNTTLIDLIIKSKKSSYQNYSHYNLPNL
ncbi:BatD family protein [Vibrio astriarenae]